MIKIIFRLLLGLAISSQVIYARIGETEPQLISRYGPIVGTKIYKGFPVLEFVANGFEFNFSMIDGMAEALIVRKKNDFFTSQEVIQLLERNKTGDGDWLEKATDQDSLIITFAGPNGEYAEYKAKDRSIVLMSQKFIRKALDSDLRQKEMQKKRDEDEAKKALEGF